VQRLEELLGKDQLNMYAHVYQQDLSNSVRVPVVVCLPHKNEPCTIRSLRRRRRQECVLLWGQRDSPAGSAMELVRDLDATWAFIEARVQRWTPADCARTFPDEMDGQVYEVSRSWVISHVMEHDRILAAKFC
jgi:hypothetical protein